MARVTGIGGIFFTAADPGATKAWYAEKLGVAMNEHYWDFQWREAEAPEIVGHTVWAPFAEGTQYFAPSTKPFMVNLRVEDLDGLLAPGGHMDVALVAKQLVQHPDVHGLVVHQQQFRAPQTLIEPCLHISLPGPG